MKVLISGSFWHGSLEESYARAFESIGWNVLRFDWDQFAKAHPLSKMAFFDIVLRQRIADRVGKWLVASVEDAKPDLIFVVKGKTIGAGTLANVKRILGDRPLVNFNPDSPWDAANRSRRLLESIPMYDAHFTWSRRLQKEFEQAGAEAVHHLPFAYDPALHQPIARTQMPIYDATFVGTYSQERDEILGEISDLNIAIVGNGWEKAHRVPKNRILSAAKYGKDSLDIMALGHCSINILRPQNADSHNMRTFEIPASGVAMVTTRSSEQSTWFAEGRDIECYATTAELREKILRLKNDSEFASRLAQNGRTRVQEETYAKRAHTILNTLGING